MHIYALTGTYIHTFLCSLSAKNAVSSPYEKQALHKLELIISS